MRHLVRRRNIFVLVATACLIVAPTTSLAKVKRNSQAAVIYVSPNGTRNADGTAVKPFSLAEGQAAVRRMNSAGHVTVRLMDGEYQLKAPLVFTTEDGGQGVYRVNWEAAPGAQPLISGGKAVSGWTMFDKANHIYVADTPAGLDARQIWVNDTAVERAFVEIQPGDVTLTKAGFTITNPELAWIAEVKNPSRMEFESTGLFTDRYTPVAKVDGKNVELQQPAWKNNTWGYDTPNKPFVPKAVRFFLWNAYEMLSKPGFWQGQKIRWYLDPGAGKLYLKVPDSLDPNNMRVVLPYLESLVSISGTYEKPIRNMTVKGIRFSYTSWMGPSKPTGYASQQSGSFISQLSAVYPKDAFERCGAGCPEFESMRQWWDQIPAAVQVAAAHNIIFENNAFTQLGQIGLGIGNDANANSSGIGLGAQNIEVKDSRFAVLSAGGILVGGVRVDAHHPEDPRQINKNIVISNNIVTDIGRDYKENAAILSTYVDTVQIVHNDVSGGNYDGIDIGWGWGYNDMGGNGVYRDVMRGYDSGENKIWNRPTVLRNNLVAYNRVHGIKRWYLDGGAIYNLSKSPGTVIRDNYIYDIGSAIGIYLDEGSRDILVTRNVVDNHGVWLNANTQGESWATLQNANNTADNNWHNSIEVSGRWKADNQNIIKNDHLVPDKAWPAEAQRVIANSGLVAGH